MEVSEKLSYQDLCATYAKERLKKALYDILERSIKKEFDEDSGREVRSALESGVIIINNLSNFLQSKTENFEEVLLKKNPVSLNQYIFHIIYLIRKTISDGADELILTQAFIDLASILESMEKTEKGFPYYFFKSLEELVYASLITDSTIRIQFRILDRGLLRLIENQYQVNPKYYYFVCRAFLYTLNKLKHFAKLQNSTVVFPTVLVVHESKNISKSLRRDTIETLDLPFFEVDDSLMSLKGGSQNLVTIKHLDTFEELDSKSIDINVEAFFRKLRGNYRKIKSETSKENWYKEKENVFAENVFFKNSPLDTSKYITINADRVDFQSLDYLITYAASLIKSHVDKSTSSKIIIRGLKQACTDDMLQRLISKLREVKLLHHKRIFFEIQFKPDENFKEKIIKSTSNIAIISDIHINPKTKRDAYICNEDRFIVHCGDTSEDFKTSVEWIKRNIPLGVFTHGNQLGYNKVPIEDQIQILRETFPKDAEVSYLNNDYKEYNGIVFIGACLYTNFELYGKEEKEKGIEDAIQVITDFKDTYRRDKYSIRKVTPEDYIEWNEQSIKYISEVTLKFINKPVVILSHYAPLPFSLPFKQDNNPLAVAYANDLRSLVDKRPNIILWCHGHMYHKSNYMYNNTRVICSPYDSLNKSKRPKGGYPEIIIPFKKLLEKNLKEENLPSYLYYNWCKKRIIK